MTDDKEDRCETCGLAEECDHCLLDAMAAYGKITPERETIERAKLPPRGSWLATRPILLFFLVAIALAGCAGHVTPPPSAPTVAQIQTAYASLAAAAASGMSPADFLTIGTTLGSQQCSDWFSTQIAGAQQNSLAQGAFGIGTTAAGAAGGPAGAGAAAALGILSSLFVNNQSNSPLGNDPTGAFILVNKTLTAWRIAAQNPQSIGDAFAFVESYSELCQLPGIQTAIREALGTANATASNPGARPLASRAMGFGDRVLPPVVVVGH